MIKTSTRPQRRREAKELARELRYDRLIPAPGSRGRQRIHAFNSRVVRYWRYA